LFWNPSLPAFRLIGENETASHGVCNTGVIFLDKLYLQKFMALLVDVELELRQLNPFQVDRFLDSLYFVRIIHKLGIPVRILPFELNYMANFEVEILEQNVSTEPFLIHHLFDTEIYCQSVDDDPYCLCSYMNNHVFEGSKIVQRLKDIIQSGNCGFLIGRRQFYENKTNHVVDEYLKQIDFTIVNTMSPANVECKLLWPLNNTVIVQPSLSLPIEFDAQFSCLEYMYPENEYNVYLSVDLPQFSNQSVSLLVELDCKGSPSGMVRLRSHVHIDIRGTDLITRKAPIALPLTFSMEIDGVVSVAYTKISVYFEGYDLDFLNDVNENTRSFPALLESQLLIPQVYLSSNKVNFVVVICCDTMKGLSTVLKFLSFKTTEDLFLLIILASSPRRIPISDAQETISLGCSSSRVRCMMQITDDINNLSILKTLQNASIDLFYTDVYISSFHYNITLQNVHPKMIQNGIMIGSRYISRFDGNCSKSIVDIAGVVNWFKFAINNLKPIGSTYAEIFYSPEHFNSEISKSKGNCLPVGEVTSSARGTELDDFILAECSPAWYMYRYR
jgi:hypothetical protein